MFKAAGIVVEYLAGNLTALCSSRLHHPLKQYPEGLPRLPFCVGEHFRLHQFYTQHFIPVPRVAVWRLGSS